MCGIIGYSGENNAKDIIIDGLSALEYRGYDSAGLTVFENNRLRTVRTTGRVNRLSTKTAESIRGKTTCGIGHTRWATHGEPSERNAHPQGNDTLMLVHNGIIENSNELKDNFIGKNYTFTSDTDTEVIAAVIEKEYKQCGDRIQSIRKASERLRGSFALGIVFSDCPDTVFATRKDSPLIIGRSSHGNFIASDISAFRNHTDKYCRLNDYETAVMSKNDITIINREGRKLTPSWQTAENRKDSADIHGFRHFMLKEIYDEPEAMKKTFEAITDNGLPDFSGTVDDDFFRSINSIHITACGTAYHAGLLGGDFIEKLARIPVNVRVASEFRYNDPVTDKNDLVIIISQSGETADSLAALRLMKSRNIRTLSVVNAQGSSMENESDCIIRTRAGAEISVASTKAFHVQVLVLLMIAIKLALINERITEADAKEIMKGVQNDFTCNIPRVLQKNNSILPVADRLSSHRNVFFIGRGRDSILATEASLKLKEISYINSQAYPAGELKHGTISLIEKGTPVISVVTDSFFYDKMKSNIREVKARGAYVISICHGNAKEITEISDEVILLPEETSALIPFSASTVIQLLAYHTANALGRDIDKPRNLAKSVTVE